MSKFDNALPKTLISIILPCLNEEATLPVLVKNINHHLSKIADEWRIIICSDGSTDKTHLVAKKLSKENDNIYELKYREQLGMGLAVKRLIEQAADSSHHVDDIVISINVDENYDLELLLEMIDKIKNSNLDVVIGSHFVSNYYIPILKRILMFCLKIFYPVRTVKGDRISDYAGNFRAYKATILQKMIELQGNKFITENNFNCNAELILGLAGIGAKIDEIQIKNYAQSKL